MNFLWFCLFSYTLHPTFLDPRTNDRPRFYPCTRFFFVYCVCTHLFCLLQRTTRATSLASSGIYAYIHAPSPTPKTQILRAQQPVRSHPMYHANPQRKMILLLRICTCLLTLSLVPNQQRLVRMFTPWSVRRRADPAGRATCVHMRVLRQHAQHARW